MASGWAERVVVSCEFVFILPKAACPNGVSSRINPASGAIMTEFSPAHECVPLVHTKKQTLMV